VIAGEPVTGPVRFLENGLAFEANVLQGQKTGFFLDQRENRAWVGAMAGGLDVLNCFSFSGGFSLSAARGGAVDVTDIDISPHAIASARRHFDLNRHLPGVSSARHQALQADVFEWLQSGPPRHYGLVVLDPPAFAKRRSERAAALSGYRRLAALGSARLRSGGLLLACSCSAQVSADDFFAAVREGVRRAGRSAVQLLTTGHPPDHPADVPETAYLKAICLRVDNGVKSLFLTSWARGVAPIRNRAKGSQRLKPHCVQRPLRVHQ
jgi:23S rRNA (cytosine1962-C5)-methyltransferase